MSKMNHLVVNLPLVYLLTFQFVFILAVTQRWTYNHATYFCQLITSFSEVTKNPNSFKVSLSLVFRKKLASIGDGNTTIVLVVVEWSQRNFGMIVWCTITNHFLKLFLEKSLETWKKWHWTDHTFIRWYIWLNKLIKFWLHIWPIFVNQIPCFAGVNYLL